MQSENRVRGERKRIYNQQEKKGRGEKIKLKYLKHITFFLNKFENK